MLAAAEMYLPTLITLRLGSTTFSLVAEVDADVRSDDVRVRRDPANATETPHLSS